MQAAESTPVARPVRDTPGLLAFGPFAFDPRARILTNDGRELALPPRVLGVLEILLERAGQVVPRQDLIDTVWKDAFVTDTSLAEAVSVLRQTLGDDPQAPTYIQTHHRRGYRFVAAVTESPRTAAAVDRRTTDTSHLSVVVSPSIGGQLIPWSAAILFALLGAAAVWQLTHQRDQTTLAARFAIPAIAGTSFDAIAPALAISPDGTQIAWSACNAGGCRLYVRAMDRLEAVPLAGTDGGHAPFFSPDGRWIAFFADGRLKKAAVAGGAPMTLADAPTPLGGAWIDREIVFAGSPSGGLMRVSADGGDARQLTTPDERNGEVRHAWPALVPGRRTLLFTIDTTAVDRTSGVMGGLAFDESDGGRPRWRTLVAGAALARPAAADAIVFARGPELHAVAFDAVRLATAGAPRSIFSPLATAGGLAHYALSPAGSLAYITAPQQAVSGLSWWSGGDVDPVVDEVRLLHAASLSPDGSRVAGVRSEGTRTDVWVADVRRGAAVRLTHSGVNTSPVWSADGRTVYFAARTDGPFEIWARAADGAQPARRVLARHGDCDATKPGCSPLRHALPIAASTDGHTLAFLQTADGTRADIWGLQLDGGGLRGLVQGPFDEHAASFSPDSALLAFESAETGRWEIYVQRLSDGRRVVVSTDGGERPVWAKDGLYYQSRGRLIRATVANDAADLRVSHSDPIPGFSGVSLRAVAPDGRVLVDRPDDLSQSSIVVSLEWVRELRSILGPPAAALPR
jgi:DNA-binding winged helix-turn-helix (wHTH) protein/Tol biopolymer transport system component